MLNERNKLIKSLIFPFILILILWIIKVAEVFFGFDLGFLGILPLKARGMVGIFTSPLIHADFGHLTSNTLPLFVLTAGLFYFYREIAFRIFFLNWFLVGLWVWLFARGEAYHIGASGLVYGLASFHLFSGLIRREPKLMAFSLLVIFLYGSIIWGIFPQFFPNKPISWESHLMGLISGIVLAVYYRNDGIQRKKYEWPEEDDDDENAEYAQYSESGEPLPKEPEKKDESKPEYQSDLTNDKYKFNY